MIVGFVFGCVQFAFADESFNKAIEYVRQNDNREYTDYYYIYYNCKNEKKDLINVSACKVSDYDFIGVLQNTFFANDYRFYCKPKDSDTWQLAYQDTKEYISCWANSQYHAYDKLNGMDCYERYFGSEKDNVNISANFPIYVVDFNPMDYDTSYVINRLSNYALADGVDFKSIFEYDSDIEIPLNLDIRLNGSSDFVPNVKISCNQTEQVENRYLEVRYSIGYKATWTLLGGIGLNIKSKISPTVYGSIEQLEESFDNGGTSFETIFPMTKISHSVAPDKEMFSQYEPTPKVYWSLKEIKNHNSEMKIWCRNRVGNKASKWVMVSGDSHKANFDVVSSDENGGPTDLKDDTANSDSGYGSEYWNNRDTTPTDDYSNVDVKTNLKDLKSNYSSLVNFYKELFGFLPAEIWILLIGLVSTMVIIAIIKFVRG